MLNLKDLWIGENVKLKSNQKEGKFEGRGAKNHAFVRINGKMHLIEASDLEIVKEEDEPTIDLGLGDEPAKPFLSVKTDIDLHIESLSPELENTEPSRILAVQIERTKRHLNELIERKMYTGKIIHGKGTGQLKDEVHHILKGYKEVSHFHTINDGGATEVLFSYT